MRSELIYPIGRRIIQWSALNLAFIAAAVSSVLLLLICDPQRPPESPDDSITTRVTGWISGPVQIYDSYLEFCLTPTEVTQRGKLHSLTEDLLIRVQSSLADPEAFFDPPLGFGDVVAFSGRLVEPSFNLVPGVPDRRVQALLKGTYYRVRLKSPLLLERIEGQIGLFVKLQKPLFNYIESFERFCKDQLSSEGYELALGAFLGRSAALSPDLRRKLQNAGLQHLFVVSGLHVAVVLFSFHLLLRRLGFAGKLIGIGLTWLYILGIGAPVPALRAGIMTTLSYGIYHFTGQTRPINCLGVAALLILVFSPSSIHSVSFQLSFLCLIAICFIGLPTLELSKALAKGLSDQGSNRVLVSRERRIEFRRKIRFSLEEKLQFLVLIPQILSSNLFGHLLGSVSSLLIVSLSIQIILYPISLFYFNRWNWFQLPGNLILVPLFSVIIPVAVCLFLTFWSPLRHLSAPLLDQLSHWAVLTIDALNGLQSAAFVAQPSTLQIFSYYGLLALALIYIKFNLRFCFLSLFLIILFIFQWDGKKTNGKLEITFLDVGQADCIHLRYPNGESALIDTGGVSYGKDPDYSARQVISRYLSNEGVQGLSYILLTHPESDHSGGYSFLSGVFPVQRLLYYRAQKGYLEPSIQVAKGSTFVLGQTVHEVLHPPRKGGTHLDTNDSSLVIRITYGRFSALFTGDISKRSERELGNKLEQVTLLKVAHHGSNTSSSALFINRSSPTIAVISAGRRNPFGHPSNQVINRLERAGSSVFSTQSDGTLRLSTDGVDWELKSFRSDVGFQLQKQGRFLRGPPRGG